MKRTHSIAIVLALMLAGLGGMAAISGCQKNHPDKKQALYNMFSQNDLRSVEVFQDRDKGEITLRGIVASPDQKTRAVALAQRSAPGYTIKDQIQVQSAGLEGMEKAAEKNTALDNAIEDGFKTSIHSHKRLGRESIQYSANNGTLYLKGSVRTEREKEEAEDLAKKVPQVQHVVNDIAVKPS